MKRRPTAAAGRRRAFSTGRRKIGRPASPRMPPAPLGDPSVSGRTPGRPCPSPSGRELLRPANRVDAVCRSPFPRRRSATLGRSPELGGQAARRPPGRSSRGTTLGAQARWPFPWLASPAFSPYRRTLRAWAHQARVQPRAAGVGCPRPTMCRPQNEEPASSPAPHGVATRAGDVEPGVRRRPALSANRPDGRPFGQVVPSPARGVRRLRSAQARPPSSLAGPPTPFRTSRLTGRPWMWGWGGVGGWWLSIFPFVFVSYPFSF